jgi:hypothetical protein
MLQRGRATWEGATLVSDCELILSSLDTYRNTLAVMDDLLTNGVPMTPNGHCVLQAAYAKWFEGLAASMREKQKSMCAQAILLYCNPVPMECL